MRSNFDDVGAFHDRFGLHSVTRSGPGKGEVPDELMRFRIKFLHEETDEFRDAVSIDDHPGMFDALIDLVYVAMGTAHLLGYPWQEGWDRVQAANMLKVRAQPDGSDSKRSSQWDVVKPEGWEPPDIAGVLEAHGY